MNLVDLFPEIQFEILHFCSPRDLAALSRVHASLRGVAEQVLYGHIYFTVETFDVIRDDVDDLPWELTQERLLPLSTLNTNSQKAAMVKSLHVELLDKPASTGIKGDGSFIRVLRNGSHFILASISHSLRKLPNLVDLRIVEKRGGLNGQISHVIRGSHFRLTTLWLDHDYDLAGIIAGQPNLRFLGIYGDSTELGFFTKIRELFQNAVPTICLLYPFTPEVSQLEMFPASHRSGEVLQECREIARSLGEFPKHYDARRKYHLKFNLFRITNENTNMLAEVMKGVATYFPHILFTSLEIAIDDNTIKPWRIPEFIDVLPLFGSVQDVGFNFPNITKPFELEPFVTDIYGCLMKGLGLAWPGVKRVIVRSSYEFSCQLLNRSSNWYPIGGLDVVYNEDEDVIYEL